MAGRCFSRLVVVVLDMVQGIGNFRPNGVLPRFVKFCSSTNRTGIPCTNNYERRREGQDIVIASRFAKGGTMVGCPFVRAVFSYGIAWILRLAIGLPGVKDYSTFYRAYRINVLSQGFERYGDGLLAGKGFAAITALLIKLGNVTKRMCEVPFVLR